MRSRPSQLPHVTHDGHGFLRGDRQLGVRDTGQVARYSEIGWMAHRPIPLIQPPGVPFDNQWKDKWRVIDEGFALVSASLSKETGKPIGAAIVEYVNAKFPFNADTEFPWR
jgi:hypothetical protein